MSVIDKDDMRGAFVRQKVVCLDCLTDAEDTKLEQKQVITEAGIERDEEMPYFCDRCKKRL